MFYQGRTLNSLVNIRFNNKYVNVILFRGIFQYSDYMPAVDGVLLT